VGLKIPIIPMRGQILVTEAVEPIIRIPAIEGRYLVMKRNPELLQQTNEARLEITCNISQSPRGNLHIGASKEFIGHNVNCSPRVLSQLARNAIKFFPDLSTLHIIRSYAGLRPHTSDGLPIIGQVQKIGGLIIAAGHGGDGITLAPITGKLVSEIITSGEPSMCIDELALTRFN
jgi:glycine/D-amino acid oxidase-like deaminating enzyme